WVDAHAARRDRPCGRLRDGVQPQRLRRAALGRAGQERRGLDLQALCAGSAAREDEQIPRLVPRAAPATAGMSGECRNIGAGEETSASLGSLTPSPPSPRSEVN